MPKMKTSKTAAKRFRKTGTGKLRWTFHTIPHPGEFGYDTWPEKAWTYSGSANCWVGMALDAERGIDGLSLGPDEALIGPLSRAHDQAAEDLGNVRTLLQRTTAGCNLLADILETLEDDLLLVGSREPHVYTDDLLRFLEPVAQR